MNKQLKQKCPSCSGFGKIFGAFYPLVAECDTCNGKGFIDDIQTVWMAQGKMLKDYRLNELKLGLREACRKYGYDASNLSKMERGIIKPVTPKEIYND